MAPTIWTCCWRRAWGSRSMPNRWSRRPRGREWIMPISGRCCSLRVIRPMRSPKSTERRHAQSPGLGILASLGQRQRDIPDAVLTLDQHQYRLPVLGPLRLDFLHHVVRRCNLGLLHFDDNVTGLEPTLRRHAALFDIRDYDALLVGADLEPILQVLRDWRDL